MTHEKIPNWLIYGLGLIAITILAVFGLAFLWGGSSVCNPCGNPIDFLCILQYQFCKIFHDIGYFGLVATGAALTLVVILLMIKAAFGDLIDFTKIAAFILIPTLFVFYLVLGFVDIGANLLVGWFPVLGDAASLLSESVLEFMQTIVTALLTLLGVFLGIKLKGGQ